MKSRFFLIFLGLISFWSIMIFQAFRLQILPQERIDHWQKNQFQKEVILSPRRGHIYDRSGRDLAVTVPSYSLSGNPQKIEDPKSLSLKLGKILNIPFSQIQTQLQDKRRHFVLLHPHLNKKAKEKIEALNHSALSLKETVLRVYPNGHLLSQVLGFVGREGSGLEGLELEYNEFLKGEKKNLFLKKDAHGRPLLAQNLKSLEVPEGYHLHLTIDSELQFVLEKTLTSALSEYQADSAIGLILHAKTGEILAMSNVPNFDLNHPLDFPISQRRNRSVTDLFEPGSILKAFTIAAALKRNIVTPQTKFYAEKGRFKVGGHFIREADRKNRFQWLTVTEILALSSNIGSTKVAFKLGDQGLRKTLRDFGFGRKTEVDLPGEVRGVLHPLPWKAHLLSNISFGHGVSATPLQLAASYLVFANKGVLVKPYIVKSIENPQTEEKIHFKPQVVRRVLEASDAEEMKAMLLAATSTSSTGYRARPSYLEVAGKTSTAQKFTPQKGGYSLKAYLSSFIGMVPVKDPQLIIYVIVDHPRTQYYASQVAAPLFAKMASFAMRSRQNFSSPLVADFTSFKQNRTEDKSLSLSSKSTHLAHLTEEGLNSKRRKFSQYEKFFFWKKWPKKKPYLSQKKTLAASSPSLSPSLPPLSLPSSVAPSQVSSAKSSLKKQSPQLEKMPDLTGLTLKEVYKKIAHTQVKLRATGHGRVFKTWPLRGVSLSQVKWIHVWLKHPKNLNVSKQNQHQKSKSSF